MTKHIPQRFLSKLAQTLSVFTVTFLTLNVISPLLGWVAEVNAHTVVVEVDNSDPGFLPSGSWTTSSCGVGYGDGDTLYAPAGAGESKAEWDFQVPATGNYQVLASWSMHSNRATNTAYSIHSDDATDPYLVTVDQSGANCVWSDFQLLATLHFTAGTDYWVSITNDSADGYVIADAIRLQSTFDYVDAPVNLGWNTSVTHPSDPGYRPVEVACGGITDQNAVAHNWETNPEAVAYQRQWMRPGSSVWETDPTTYTNTNTPFATFGGNPGTPGLWNTRVRAQNAAGTWSAWSNECQITYDPVDRTPPAQPSFLTVYKGHNPATWEEIGCGGYTNTPQVSFEWNLNSEPDIAGYWFGTKFNDHHQWFDHPNNVKTANMTPGNNPYYYTLIAEDTTGNESVISEQCELTLDQDAPVVEVTSHNDGDLVNGSVSIRGTVNDDYPDHYWFVVQDSSNNTVFGPGVVYSAPQDFTDMELGVWDTSAVADGMYTIKLEARDAAGNKIPDPTTGDPEVVGDSVDWVEVYVDNTPPYTYFISPSDNSYHDSPISVSGQSADDETGVDYVDVYWTTYDGSICDDTSWAHLTQFDNSSDDSPFDWPETPYDWTPATEGSYCLRAEATDIAGNLETTAYAVGVVYDTTDPLVMITNPLDGDLVNGVVDIWGYITDDNLSHYNIAVYPGGVDTWDFSERLEQQTVYGPEFPDQSIYLWDTTGYADGDYQVRLAARDLAGNRDPMIPSYVNEEGDSVMIITVTVDNTPPTVGNVTVHRDYDPYVRGNSFGFDIRMVANDLNGIANCEYTIDGGSNWLTGVYNPSRNRCEAHDINAPDGDTLTINMRAYDTTGNYTEGISILRIADSERPSVTNMTIDPDYMTTYTSSTPHVVVDVSDTVSPISSCMVRYREHGSTWASGSGWLPGTFIPDDASGMTGTCEANLSGLLDGINYDIQLRARDSVNHGLTRRLTRTVDDTFPTAELYANGTLVPDGYTHDVYEGDTIEVVINGEDNIVLDELCIEYDSTTTYCESNDGDQTHTWSSGTHLVDLSVYPEGVHTLDYWVIDEVGNRTNYTANFNVINVVPTATVSVSPSSTATQPQTITLTANVSGGNPSFTYNWNGDCSGTTSAVTLSAVGTYTCSVTVTDSDGDSHTSDNVTVTINPTPPSGPTNGGGNTGGGGTGTGGAGVLGAVTGGDGNGEGEDEDTSDEEETEEGEVLGIRQCENTSKVSGKVYFDNNDNNQQDDDEGGVEGIMIEVYYDNEGEEVVASRTWTDENGNWEVNICPGDYKVRINQEDLPDKAELTGDGVQEILVEDMKELFDINFRVKQTDKGFNWYLCIVPLVIVAVLVALWYFLSKREKGEKYSV